MKYKFTGKNVTVSEALKSRAVAKLDKLSKMLPETAEVLVTIGVSRSNHQVEVTIPLHKRILRAEVTSDDAYLAFDEIIDILEKQLVKYKERLRSRSGKDSAFKEEMSLNFSSDGMDDNGIRIGKTKRFALKPMDPEEAVMEMELLGHEFYMFRNGDTDEINVVYKRHDGSYGLIEPEC
ncbi:MAG: ribosome-associated translation inhibitor RaiA [Clostridiales bacterium]|jgi:putative sigma-54 modulation protein|nr:ribosome-associated translation inhibitor RaiA [Clostridiales bacterium]